MQLLKKSDCLEFVYIIIIIIIIIFAEFELLMFHLNIRKNFRKKEDQK